MIKKGKRADRRRLFRTLRVAADLSQLEVAQKAKMSAARYWKLENGYDDPTEDELSLLARAFKTDVAQLTASPDEAVAS